jgi:hypothetical protein
VLLTVLVAVAYAVAAAGDSGPATSPVAVEEAPSVHPANAGASAAAACRRDPEAAVQGSPLACAMIEASERGGLEDGNLSPAAARQALGALGG